MSFAVSGSVHAEELDGEFLVFVPGRDDVLRLTGDQAAAFVFARDAGGEVPGYLVTPMAGLVELGVVETEAWSRRRVLQLGGAAAAAAVAVVALPSVSAAASTPGTTTPPPSTDLVVSYLVVAGGGGTESDYPGGGGGAGGVIEGTATIGHGTCPVIVGAGGVGGNPCTNGEDSSLGLPTVVTAIGGGTYMASGVEVGFGGAGGDGGGGTARDISSIGSAGVVDTGGGGGGGGHDGGSGVVIVAYATGSASGLTVSGGDTITAGATTYHVFRSGTSNLTIS